jgi:hypothetical protein
MMFINKDESLPVNLVDIVVPLPRSMMIIKLHMIAMEDPVKIHNRMPTSWEEPTVHTRHSDTARPLQRSVLIATADRAALKVRINSYPPHRGPHSSLTPQLAEKLASWKPLSEARSAFRRDVSAEFLGHECYLLMF